MTSSFIADNAHQRKVVGQHIRDTFRGSRALSLAVAYVGEDATELLRLARQCRLTIICDLRSSACNPFAVRELARRSTVTVRVIDGLHAKVYLSESGAVVTSANLSGHALTAGSLEAGIHVSDAATLSAIRAWFDSLLAASEDARPILAREFDVLAARWRQRPASGATRRAKPSLLDALLTDDPALADYVFNFYLDDEEYTDAEVKKAAAKRGIELPPSKVWDRYEDPFDARVARYLDQEMGMKGRRSIGFDVRLDSNRISAVEGLDSEASVFVNHFRLRTTLVTNLLSEVSSSFRAHRQGCHHVVSAVDRGTATQSRPWARTVQAPRLVLRGG